MIKIRCILAKRTNSINEHDVYISYRNTRVSIGISVLPENFVGGVVTPGDKFYAQKNMRIMSFMDAAQRVELSEDPTPQHFIEVAKQLKRSKKPDYDAKVQKNNIPGTDKFGRGEFLQWYDKFVSLKTNKGTETVYTTTRNRLWKFDKLATFDSMDKTWLTKFDNDMEIEGLKINTRAIHMRNIRAVFNYAIDEDVTDKYPFRKFRIRHEETAKRSLTVEQLRTLRDYKVQKHQEKFRDCFMLMFYLIGINAVDLFSLTSKNLVNGRIVYHRAKTNRLYDIKVEPEAAAILKMYKGRNHLLSWADEWNYKNFIHRMGIELKRVGVVKLEGAKKRKVFSPLFPGLSSYWSRHTWASIASELDVPVETISQALGHSQGDVTHIYIKFDNKKVDEANRKVIDFVNQGN